MPDWLNAPQAGSYPSPLEGLLRQRYVVSWSEVRPGIFELVCLDDQKRTRLMSEQPEAARSLTDSSTSSFLFEVLQGDENKARKQYRH